MLLPALNSAREKARRISCASNQKQIGLSFQLALNYPDNPYFPPCVTGPATTDQVTSKGLDGLKYLLTQGILTDMKMYICPSTTQTPGTYSSTAADITFEEANLSYKYIPNLHSATCTSDSGILWDKDKNHDKFTNILYGDGHVASYTINGDDVNDTLLKVPSSCLD